MLGVGRGLCSEYTAPVGTRAGSLWVELNPLRSNENYYNTTSGGLYPRVNALRPGHFSQPGHIIGR